MKIFSIALVALLLMFCGYGNKVEAAAPVKQAKVLTLEERFTKTKMLAETGNVEAQLGLGMLYNMGLGVPKNAAKAVKWYQKAANHGDASAQLLLGEMFMSGEIGLPKNPTTAAKWYQKAADQGNMLAQNNLAEMYDSGEGVPKNPSKAVELYKKSASQTGISEEFILNQMYLPSFDKVKIATIDVYQKAAAQGDAAAQDVLGRSYSFGGGVPRNLATAAEWYRKAAAQGLGSAQLNLGVAYVGGQGVPKDLTTAAEWFTKAAAQGVANAQFNLGLMYERGEGVEKNCVLAYAWFKLAIAQGMPTARANRVRNRVEMLLTPAQQDESERLATNWKKGDILSYSQK